MTAFSLTASQARQLRGKRILGRTHPIEHGITSDSDSTKHRPNSGSGFALRRIRRSPHNPSPIRAKSSIATPKYTTASNLLHEIQCLDGALLSLAGESARGAKGAGDDFAVASRGEAGIAGSTFNRTPGTAGPRTICKSIPKTTTVHVACRVAEDRTRKSNSPAKAITPRAQERIAALDSCETRSIPIGLRQAAILAARQFFRQTFQLAFIQKLSIDHSDE